MELEILGMNFSCVIQSLSARTFPEKDCLLPLVSRVLGYCIVAASVTIKLPQIIKILHSRSVTGLSVVAFELEVVGYTIGLSYCVHSGLPFSAYVILGSVMGIVLNGIILSQISAYWNPQVKQEKKAQ